MKEKENNTLVRPLQCNIMTSFLYKRDHFIRHTFQFPAGLSLFTFLGDSTLFLGNFVHLYNGFVRLRLPLLGSNFPGTPDSTFFLVSV